MYKDSKTLELTGLLEESKIVKSSDLTGASCTSSAWSLTAEWGGTANRRPVRLEIPLCSAVLIQSVRGVESTYIASHKEQLNL